MEEPRAPMWTMIPLQIATRLSMVNCENVECKHYKTEQKINFQLLFSELLANHHGQFSLNGLNWPYSLAKNSDTGMWIFFFNCYIMSILYIFRFYYAPPCCNLQGYHSTVLFWGSIIWPKIFAQNYHLIVEKLMKLMNSEG